MDSPPDPVVTSPVRTWRAWLPRLLAESVLIVLSVLLALAVDQWREDRALRQRVRDARAAFAEEVHANRDLLAADDIYPYHRRMWEHYRALATATEAGDSARVAALEAADTMFTTGVHPAPLRDAVWRSLSQGDLLGRMEPRDVFLLGSV